jgi:hypothetical protein
MGVRATQEGESEALGRFERTRNRVPGFCSIKGNTCLFGNITQFFNDGQNQRHTTFLTDLFSFPFGIAGDERAFRPRGGFGSPEDLNVVVDLSFEFIGIDETVNPHGPKEVPDSLADAPFGNLLAQCERRCKGAPIGPTQDTREHIDHDSETVPFVAAPFPLRTEW